MIRSSFFFLSLVSLIYGLIFLVYPEWFIKISIAQETNIAWLRNIGSSIIGILAFGCMSLNYKMKGKLSLLRIITITCILQTGALIYSRFYNEFSAKNLLIIDLTIYLAILVSLYLIYIVVIKQELFK